MWQVNLRNSLAQKRDMTNIFASRDLRKKERKRRQANEKGKGGEQETRLMADVGLLCAE